KLMWVLGQTDDLEEVRSLMQKNIVGEITRSSITE
ncbi:MAG: asparaginase, partial [Candidatus Methanolliviera hydrocarbonicum]